MKVFFIVLLIIPLIISCGKSSKNNGTSLSSPSSPDLNPADPVVPLPSNSEGVIVEVDEENSKIQFLIPAQKDYSPTVFSNGQFFFPEQGEISLPEFIPVLGGRAGNHLAFIFIKRKVDSVGDAYPQELRCIYVGQENNTGADYNQSAKPYKFDFCINKNIDFSPAQRNQLRDGEENIILSNQRETSFLQVNRADELEIEVNNGNRRGGQNISTQVQLEWDYTYF